MTVRKQPETNKVPFWYLLFNHGRCSTNPNQLSGQVLKTPGTASREEAMKEVDKLFIIPCKENKFKQSNYVEFGYLTPHDDFEVHEITLMKITDSFSLDVPEMKRKLVQGDKEYEEFQNSKKSKEIEKKERAEYEKLKAKFENKKAKK